ncbi:MAG: epoxyqueuosine reductase QueH [bacterium]
MREKKVLIHSCCAPCTTATLEQILRDYSSLASVFYYNPNISPQEEEQKRFIELKNYIEKRYDNKIEVIKGNYDFNNWDSLVEPVSESGEKGFRCKICYYIRLLETFKKAKEINAQAVTTTLSISPHKNYEWLDEIGTLLSKKFKIEWILHKWNYKRSIELSKEFNLYRQNYCGCRFSKKRD